MDTQVENFLLNTSNDQSSGIWQLTRAMKQAGYRYKASSDATSMDTTGNPNSDLWGPGIQVGAQTATISFTIGTPSTTSYGGRSIITGLTGFTTSSPGHFLRITGATNTANNGTWLITQYISATSVVIENPAAIAETTPGTSTWTELSALLDTFPALGVGAWWCGQGPSTMKVPIGATTPTGTFIRGENVTQTTSGATGELLGVLTDPGGHGYLVIAPRLSGTGVGRRGWSTGVITGAVSGATVTPTVAVIEFVREIVFWRASPSGGHIYCQCIDRDSEATPSAGGAGRFSTMAAASATTVQCPGGSTTGNPVTNGFPTIGTYVALGLGGAGTVTTSPSFWVNSPYAINLGKCQFLVANCIEDAGISPDGTITFACGTPGAGTTTFAGWGFLRVDDQEDGDVDPYVWWLWTQYTTGNRSRTNAGGSNYLDVGNQFHTGYVLPGLNFIGWRRRGYPVGSSLGGIPSDSWTEFGGFLFGPLSSIFENNNTGDPEVVACSITPTKVRSPIFVACPGVSNAIPYVKVRKGVLRWWFVVQGNAGCDTYDGKRWIQLSSGVAGGFPIVVGPADGTTTPVNQ